MKCPRFVCLLLALSLACGGDDDGSLDGSTGGGDSGGRRDAGPPSTPNPCRIALPVDLVFVVDNSHSMQEEQASLIANFPLLIETLTTPSDRDGDGVDDPGVSDLRVAIVTTDMGVGVGNTSEFCPSADGDDGRFVYEARSAEAACAGFVVPEGGRWLELDPADPRHIGLEQCHAHFAQHVLHVVLGDAGLPAHGLDQARQTVGEGGGHALQARSAGPGSVHFNA